MTGQRYSCTDHLHITIILLLLYSRQKSTEAIPIQPDACNCQPHSAFIAAELEVPWT